MMTVNPTIGSPVTLLSSPYALHASHVLLNTHTSGIVSNIINDSDGSTALVMTDASTLPGSFGGAVLHGRSGSVVGVLLPPITMTTEYSLQLSFALPITRIMSALNIQWYEDRACAVLDSALQDGVDFTAQYSSVVSVSCGPQFATGVVISRSVSAL